MNTSQCQRVRVKSDRKVYLPPAVTGELTAGIGTTIGDLIEGCAVLSILADDTSEFYWATAILDGGRIVGVRLGKFGSGTSYDVCLDPETGESSCTCPDHVWRNRSCKHIVALTAVLSAVAVA